MPDRWANRVPPLLVELTIGVAVATVLVFIRGLFGEVAGDRAPYALNFLAVVVAAVLAGWRSGIVALVLGQLLIWYAIVPPYFSFEVPDGERLGGLLIDLFASARPRSHRALPARGRQGHGRTRAAHESARSCAQRNRPSDAQ